MIFDLFGLLCLWAFVVIGAIYLVTDAEFPPMKRWRRRRAEKCAFWKGLLDCRPCVGAYLGPPCALLLLPLVEPPWWGYIVAGAVACPAAVGLNVILKILSPMIALRTAMEAWNTNREGDDGKG